MESHSVWSFVSGFCAEALQSGGEGGTGSSGGEVEITKGKQRDLCSRQHRRGLDTGS